MWWFVSHGFVSAPKCRMSPGFHGWYQSVSTRPVAQFADWFGAHAAG